MKILLIGVALLAIMAGGWLALAWHYRYKPKARAVAVDRDGEDLRRIGTDMARFLESSLGDPVARTESQWEDKALRLVDDWYGK